MYDTWMHHYTSKFNLESVEWLLPNEIRSKMFPKALQLAGKVLVSNFCDSHGIILIDYLSTKYFCYRVNPKFNILFTTNSFLWLTFDLLRIFTLEMLFSRYRKYTYMYRYVSMLFTVSIKQIIDNIVLLKWLI